jgi:hypothetical protein
MCCLSRVPSAAVSTHLSAVISLSTHTHTHTCVRALSLSLTHIHSHESTLTHSLTYTLTHSLTRTLAFVDLYSFADLFSDHLTIVLNAILHSSHWLRTSFTHSQQLPVRYARHVRCVVDMVVEEDRDVAVVEGPDVVGGHERGDYDCDCGSLPI